jgi:hypothetical protein
VGNEFGVDIFAQQQTGFGKVRVARLANGGIWPLSILNSRLQHENALLDDQSATLGQVNLQTATNGTKGSTTNEVIFDGSVKTLQTEMLTGWRKNATEFWGTVRGDGILRFLKAIISDFTD